MMNRYYFQTFVIVALVVTTLACGTTEPPQVIVGSSPPFLWLLASDENYTNSRMVAYDPTRHKTVREVVFPSELVILSATWSPNMNYLATIIGYRGDNLRWHGDNLCLFDKDGEGLGCQSFSVLEVRYDFTSGPAPIAWSQDSRHVFAAAKILSENAIPTVQVAILDVDSMTVSFLPGLSIRPDRFISWDWAIDTGYAVATVVGEKEAEMHLIRLSSPLDDQILATSLWSPTWSPDQHSIVYLIAQGAASDLRVAHMDRDRIVTTEDFGVLESISVPLALSWSSDAHRIAIVSPTFDQELNSLQAGIFLFSTDSRETELVYQSPLEEKSLVPALAHMIYQLEWSPDDGFIAFTMCHTVVPEGIVDCQINIWADHGQVVAIETGLPENRDPMWMVDG